MENRREFPAEMEKHTLSVVMPAYNEGKTIEQVVRRVAEALERSGIDYQMIIVDDGSKDDTLEIARTAIEAFVKSDGKVVPMPKNSGKGAAIRMGLQYVTGDYVVIQDADLEYDPEDIVLMFKYLLKENLDVLYGSRFMKKENKHSYQRFYWGGRLVTLVTNLLFFQRLTDEPTCYKMLKTDLINSLDLKCEGFEFCPEVTAKVAKRGYKIKEIPIRYYPRSIEEGKKIKWMDGVEAIWTLLRYRFKN